MKGIRPEKPAAATPKVLLEAHPDLEYSSGKEGLLKKITERSNIN